MQRVTSALSRSFTGMASGMTASRFRLAGVVLSANMLATPMSSFTLQQQVRCQSSTNTKQVVTDSDEPDPNVDYTPVIKELTKVIKENDVVLFMKGDPDAPQCGFSAKIAEALYDVGLDDYVFIDVLKHPLAREGVKRMSDWPTIPQLFVKGEFVGGSDIVLAMAEAGELKELFVENNIELSA